MLFQGPLDFAGVDVFPAGDDQVFFPVYDEQEALLVQIAYVAHGQPAIPQDLSGSLGVVPVALHEVRMAHKDLAGLADSGGIASGVEDLQFHAGIDLTGGQQAALLLRAPAGLVLAFGKV